eukprot:1898355-Karenia_brevis.AAC.1
MPTLHTLKVVDSYKHLGTSSVSSAGVHPEIKRRMKSMSSDIRPMARCVLHNTSLDIGVKSTYATAYLISHGYYNAGTWPKLTAAEHRSLHAGTMKIYRHMILQKHNDHLCDLEILRSANAYSPLALLMIHRISLLVRMLCHPHIGTLTNLYHARNHKRSWIRAIWHDLKFYSTVTDELQGSLQWPFCHVV